MKPIHNATPHRTPRDTATSSATLSAKPTPVPAHDGEHRWLKESTETSPPRHAAVRETSFEPASPPPPPGPHPRQRLARRIARSRFNNALLAKTAHVSCGTVSKARAGQSISEKAENALHGAIDLLLANGAPRAQSIGPRGVAAVQRRLRQVLADDWSFRVIAQVSKTHPTLAQLTLSQGSGMTRSSANALLGACRTLLRSSAPMPELRYDAESVAFLRERLAPTRGAPEVMLIPKHAVALAQLIRAARAKGVEVDPALVRHERPSPLGREAWAILDDLERQLEPRPRPALPPEPERLPARARALAHLERSRWTAGAHVYAPDLGVGRVERVIDSAGEGPHDPEAMVTVSFSHPVTVTRRVGAFEPVLSLSELLAQAELPQSMAKDVANDSRLVADVPAQPKDPSTEPFYRYERVEEVRRLFKQISAPRAAALQRRLRHEGFAVEPLAEDSGLSRSTVQDAFDGNPVNPHAADWLVSAVDRLNLRGAPKNQQVSTRAVLRELERTEALGWGPETCGLNGKVTSRFLAMLRSGQAQHLGRGTALELVRGLRLLRAAAAPLPPLLFVQHDVALLEARLTSVQTGPFQALPPGLHAALLQILEDAQRSGVALSALRLSSPAERQHVAMRKAIGALGVLRADPRLKGAP